MLEEVSKVIVGKDDVIEKLLLAVLANGHVLIEDYPGLAKTLMAKCLAKTLGCKFTRVQFTPDLLPADITGTYVYNQRTGEFELRKGPIFTNVLLADEINRSPPKCISGDELVYLANGKVVEIERIFEFKSGDVRAISDNEWIMKPKDKVEVLSFDGRIKVVKRSIAYVYKQLSREPVYLIRLEHGGELKCSPNHGFYVINDGKISLKEAKWLEEGDIILSARNLMHQRPPKGLFDAHFDRVDSIIAYEGGKLKAFYDLSIEGLHNYVCGQGYLITHNTQAALLEAMQERQVTLDGKTHRLENPFIVIATQNPIEYEGVYPLPEAQLDRFLMKIRVGYPKTNEEKDILKRRLLRKTDDVEVRMIIYLEDVLDMQRAVEEVHIDDCVLDYIVEVVRRTRVHPRVEVGCSPRATVILTKLARAIAALRGRDYVLPDDVKYIAIPALAHRIILRSETWVKGFQPQSVVEQILNEVPVPKV